MENTCLPAGFRAAGLWSGIVPQGRGFDLGLLWAEAAAPAAAVFTRNALWGAHIHVCRDHLARSGGLVRAIVVNSGCANCATGPGGIDDARATARAVAELVGCPEHEVLPVSTGAIGSRLPMAEVLAAVPALVGAAREDGAADFARAIMTTDTHPKTATTQVPNANARVTGFAKGAGMIHPDMATMLAFLTTDAELPRDAGTLLRESVDRTFHRITVDGDTSPNDTVVLWASGRYKTTPGSVENAIVDVGSRLCRQIAADGEGATRLITVEVRGARSEHDAVSVGRAIATSPLTKTAVAGRDPNWGRILSAAGCAGVPIDVGRARVWIGGATLFEGGRPFPEREEEAWKHLRDRDEVTLGIDLAAGEARADVWTCDLTAEYVRINAEYRT